MQKHYQYSRKRTAHPSDRHKRVNALRHTPYISSNTKKVISVESDQNTELVENVQNTEIEDVVESESFTGPDIDTEENTSPVEEVSEKGTVEEVQQEVKKEKKTFRDKRRERKHRIQQSRLAEVDAILGKKKNRLPDLLLHPYRCMINEGKSEISSSFLSSLFRLILVWITAAAMVAYTMNQIVNTQNYSYIRFNFSETSNLGLRILFIIIVCEILTAFCNMIFARLAGNHIKFKRILAVRSACWLFQLVGFLISGIVYYYYPGIGFIILTVFILMGISLNTHAQSEALDIQIELQTVVTIVCLFMCAFIIFNWISFVEQPLISLLLEIYG